MSDGSGKTYKPNQLPASITRTLFIGYGMGKWNAGEITLNDFDYRGSCSDYAIMPLTTHEVTIEIPRCEVDVKGELLKVLEAEKQDVLADNHKRLKEVQDKIDNLLAIEYKPEAA